MKKFKLNLSALKVESFKTDTPQKENGTVKGHYDIEGPESPRSNNVSHCIDSRCLCIIPSRDGSCHFTCEEDCSNLTCDC